LTVQYTIPAKPTFKPITEFDQETGVTSPYALIGEKLVDAGYPAIPVRPGEKLPGSMSFGQWYGEMNWQRFCSRLPTEIEIETWNKWKDAGVCITLGLNGLLAIDIDTDDPEIVAAIMSCLPESPVGKRGAKGKTLFYRGNVQKTDPITGDVTGSIPSRGFNVAGNQRVLDLLAFGKETVVPPTIHPGTGKPYHWITNETLVDVPVEQLPILPDNIADLLAIALGPWGYVEPTSYTKYRVDDSDNYWRGLKDLAYANLDIWVPHLGLPLTKKVSRDNWRAAAAWRPMVNSNAEGMALSFTSKGIKDYGDGEKTYSPIDVVMASHHSDVETATRWLAEKLDYKIDDGALALWTNDWLDKYEKRQYVAPPISMSLETEQPSTPIDAPRGEIDSFEPTNADGLLGAIAQFTHDTSYRPSREFSMMAAIAFMSALCNRRYVTPAGFGTNVYLVGLAPPSFGKEHPQNVIKTLAHDTGKSFLLGAGEVSSGSAIEKVVRRAPNSLFIWDELGIILQSMNAKNAASHSDSIRKVLLDIYSKSRHGSSWYGKETADAKKDNAAIHSPTMSLIGFSTTTEFYRGLPEKALTDGFLARVMIVQAEQRGDRQKTDAMLIPPPALIAAINKCADDYPARGNLAGNFRDPNAKPQLYAVKWENYEAEYEWMRVDDWQQDSIENDASKYGRIGRASENTQKLATLRAVSRNSRDPRITAEDIKWGYAIVQRSFDNVESGTRIYMADSEHERLGKTILEAVANSPDKTMHLSTMIRRRGISKFDERMRNAAIKDLVTTGQLKQVGRAYTLGED
jgi:hypothetical protein